MCAGVVPQQPPTIDAPNSSAKRRCALASSAGVRWYTARPSQFCGRPAFGCTDTMRVLVRPRWRTCSTIRSGPVAQLRPTTSTGSDSSTTSAAAVSVPTSIVPVVSTVICTRSGTWTPRSCIARLAASTAHLTCRMSWQVSIRTPSTPPSISPAICVWML